MFSGQNDVGGQRGSYPGQNAAGDGSMMARGGGFTAPSTGDGERLQEVAQHLSRGFLLLLVWFNGSNLRRLA
jgi:hypothetical protein